MPLRGRAPADSYGAGLGRLKNLAVRCVASGANPSFLNNSRAWASARLKLSLSIRARLLTWFAYHELATISAANFSSSVSNLSSGKQKLASCERRTVEPQLEEARLPESLIAGGFVIGEEVESRRGG